MHNLCSQAHFGPLLGYCDHQIHKLMARKLLQFDVSPVQCRALTFLNETDHPVNQRQLEQFLMVKPSTASGIVGRLEEKGFLQRCSSKDDGRCRMLTLTEKGRAFYHEFCDIASLVTEQAERGFSREESAILRSLLLRVADNLNEEDTE